MADKEKDSERVPKFDGNAGLTFDVYEEYILNYTAGKTDDRGWSCADYLTGIDEGGALGPAWPVGAATELRKAQQCRRRRQKESYAIISRSQSDPAIITVLKSNYFQDGLAAWQYMTATYRRPVDRILLREMDKQWHDLDLQEHVGINENTIKQLVLKMRVLNGKRPAANRKTETEITEKLLECIFQTSKHFSEGSLQEYNAAPADWRFVHAAGTPLAGQRDLAACEAHYHNLWSQAVRDKLPGFHLREPARRSSTGSKQVLEAGVHANDGSLSPHEQALAGDCIDTLVPANGSPGRSLSELAYAGCTGIATKRGTVTTTDFGLLNAEELSCIACNEDAEEGVAGQFDIAYVFDADDTASVEVICDNCRGLGHLRRVCPSNRNRFRSLQYAITVLQKKQDSLKGVMRKPPPRGQRPPFRQQPRRFQPRKSYPPKPMHARRNQRGQSAEEGDESSTEDEDESGGIAAEGTMHDTGGKEKEEENDAKERCSETAKAATTAAFVPQMPMAFSCADDAIFVSERANLAACNTAANNDEVHEASPVPPARKCMCPWCANETEPASLFCEICDPSHCPCECICRCTCDPDETETGVQNDKTTENAPNVKNKTTTKFAVTVVMILAAAMAVGTSSSSFLNQEVIEHMSRFERTHPLGNYDADDDPDGLDLPELYWPPDVQKCTCLLCDLPAYESDYAITPGRCDFCDVPIECDCQCSCVCECGFETEPTPRLLTYTLPENTHDGYDEASMRSMQAAIRAFRINLPIVIVNITVGDEVLDTVQVVQWLEVGDYEAWRATQVPEPWFHPNALVERDSRHGTSIHLGLAADNVAQPDYDMASPPLPSPSTPALGRRDLVNKYNDDDISLVLQYANEHGKLVASQAVPPASVRTRAAPRTMQESVRYLAQVLFNLWFDRKTRGAQRLLRRRWMAAESRQFYNERAFRGKASTEATHALVPARKLSVCPVVDSGCTSTSIPARLEYLLTKVIDASPNIKLWIADDKALTVLKVGTMALPVSGYKLGSGPSARVRDTLHCSRVLVVEGLGPETILLSVKGMLLDGVKTFLNNDNSISTGNCLLLPSGTVVPFAPGRQYQINLCGDESAQSAEDQITSPAKRAADLVHQALSHVGVQRMRASNIVVDGARVSAVSAHQLTCKGCRLGNTGKSRAPHKRAASAGGSTAGFSHFGQQVDSDICTGFEKSFPHQFVAMINFCDRHTGERDIYFLRSATSPEVASSLEHYAHKNRRRLPDGRIGRWLTDNGLSFHGSDVGQAASALVENRGFAVPDDSDTHPVAERHWGVLERMMRSDLSHAGAPECLWPWGAMQANHILYYLPTAAHTPPMSPYQFVTGNKEPVDLSWARTMYCDVTVSIPERDWHGKLSNRSADGVHLGYDPRRHSHFVYVESLKRISSYRVTEWRERSFAGAQRVSADTPVGYHEVHDLSISPVTSQLVPRRHNAHAAVDRLHVLILFDPDDKGSLPAALRARGHRVTAVDKQSGTDLLDADAQHRLIADLGSYHFVFMSPPCKTCCIQFDPPLRTKSHPLGSPDMNPKYRDLVSEANDMYELCVKVILACDGHRIPWAVESAAARDSWPCRWEQYAKNGFLWDILRPRLQHISPEYMAFAQCAFGAPWQKYTGVMVDRASGPAFRRLLAHAVCNCKSHAIKLAGYDDATGSARTRIAESYLPGVGRVFAACVEDASRPRLSAQEGETQQTKEQAHMLAQHCTQDDRQLREWTDSLCSQDRQQLMLAAATDKLQDQKKSEIDVKLGQAIAELLHDNDSDDDDIAPNAQHDGHANRVSEVGSVPVPSTVKEAQQLPQWPLFKEAMEEEIQGKMMNQAWNVVPRPAGKHVMKSKWVFAVKYKPDKSIRRIKARIVACGYSQTTEEYSQVYASTLPGICMRALMSWIADEDLETDHIDAVKAFTQADVDHTLYVEMPEGFALDGFVLLLNKALEGIRQGANLWFKHNRAALTQCGFVSWINEPNLYTHPKHGFRIGVFADDVLVGYKASKKSEYLEFKKAYSRIIRIETLEIEPALKFIGVQIQRDRQARTITLYQSQYIEQMAAEYEGKFELHDTPHPEKKEERQKLDNLRPAPEEQRIDRSDFLQVMGKLVWPSNMTRPDVSQNVSHLCTFSHCAGKEHLSYAFYVMGYLVKTKHLGITFGGSLRPPPGIPNPPESFFQSSGLYIMHDSSWGTKAKPMGGHVIMYNNGPLGWSAKIGHIIPQSTAEAELVEGTRAAKEGMFTIQLLQNNNRRVVSPVIICGDNKAMVDMVQQEGASVRTRYYERAILLLKRAVLMLVFRPVLVPTDLMLADIFTKATEKGTFIKLRNIMMNNNGVTRGYLATAISTLHGASRKLAVHLLSRM